MAPADSHPGSRQLGFEFPVPRPPEPTGGSLYCGHEVRAALSGALKGSPLSRYQVAARMSELLALEVTKHQLDSWTAESREGWRFPFEYAPAFEVSCGSMALTGLLSRKRGCSVLVGEEILKAELGQLEMIESDVKRRRQELRRRLERRA